MEQDQTLKIRMVNAFQQREGTAKDSNVYRLFNGFYEGLPGVVLDRYGQTLVILDHRELSESQSIIKEIPEWVKNHLHWASSILLKQRNHPDQHMKNGKLLWGEVLDSSIQEFNVKYALDLQINQDASFYPDTRNLRLSLIHI